MPSKIFKGNSLEIKQKKGRKVKVIIIIFISTRDATFTYCALLTLTRPNIILSCTHLIAALASHSQRSLLLLLLLFSSICCAYDFNHYPRPYPVLRSTLLPFSFLSVLASAATLYLSFPSFFFLSFFLSYPSLCLGSTNHCDRRSQPYWQHLLLLCCYS